MIDAIDPVSGSSSAEGISDVPAIPYPAVVGDTVSLSIPAQAQLLEQQGFSLTEIALQLGLPMNVVQSGLEISPVTPTQQVSTTRHA